MKIFISWSGDVSREVAAVLNGWLPLVNQHIEPFMSSEDIEKGSRWLSHLSQELQDTNFGLLCLTPDNVDAPWICFEAGALAKIVDSARVVPLLFGLLPSDVKGPLAQFQITKFEYEDFARLIRGINASAGAEARDDPSLERMLKICWPELQDKMAPILKKAVKSTSTSIAPTSTDKSAEILEELLLQVRQQSQLLADPRTLLPREYLERAMGNVFREGKGFGPDHPVWRNVSESLWEAESSMSKLRSKIAPTPAQANAAFEAFVELRRHLQFVLHRQGKRRRLLGEPGFGERMTTTLPPTASSFEAGPGSSTEVSHHGDKPAGEEDPTSTAGNT